MTVTMRGEVLAGEPGRGVRRYRDTRPGTGHERLVTYLLGPAPGGALLRCEIAATVPGLGRWGGDSLCRAEAASLAHSLDGLARLAAGRSPSPWRAVFVHLFPKASLPL